MDSVEISNTNRSVFENLPEVQITRLIDPTRVGQTLEGLVVTERIQAELRAWVMEQNKKESFCCGAGGGNMWYEIKTGERINKNR